MVEYGFLPEKKRALVEGETAEFADSTVRDYRSKIENRTELVMEDLLDVAESEHVKVDDEIWYRYLPELLAVIMQPSEDVVPFEDYDGGELAHRREYPLQYALLDRLNKLQNTWTEAYAVDGWPR